MKRTRGVSITAGGVGRHMTRCRGTKMERRNPVDLVFRPRALWRWLFLPVCVGFLHSFAQCSAGPRSPVWVTVNERARMQCYGPGEAGVEPTRWAQAIWQYEGWSSCFSEPWTPDYLITRTAHHGPIPLKWSALFGLLCFPYSLASGSSHHLLLLLFLQYILLSVITIVLLCALALLVLFDSLGFRGVTVCLFLSVCVSILYECVWMRACICVRERIGVQLLSVERWRVYVLVGPCRAPMVLPRLRLTKESAETQYVQYFAIAFRYERVNGKYDPCT